MLFEYTFDGYTALFSGRVRADGLVEGENAENGIARVVLDPKCVRVFTKLEEAEHNLRDLGFYEERASAWVSRATFELKNAKTRLAEVRKQQRSLKKSIERMKGREA